HYLRSPRLGANPQVLDGGFFARSFYVFDVGGHGLAENVEAAFADVQVVADPAGRKGNRRVVGKRILRLGPSDQARPEYGVAVGDRGDHYGDLQWCHRQFTLAEADVRSVAVEPRPAEFCFAPLARRKD